MTEQNIAANIFDKFESLTGMSYKMGSDLFQMGGGLLVTIGNTEPKNSFKVALKAEFRQDQLPGLLKLFEKSLSPCLLVAKYIPKPLKVKLREREVNYLEASGNCFIKGKNLFVLINDQPVTEVRQLSGGKLWKPAGLKFVFAVLQDPGVLNLPYRTIARHTKLGLGTIGPLIEDLKAEGYLAEKKTGDKRGRGLMHRDQLIKKWSPLFYANLRPTLLKGRYRFMKPEMQQNWKQIDQKHFIWGGENAGALLTDFLRPELFTLYTSEYSSKLMKDLLLVPDPKGNVQVFEKFWTDAPIQETGVVPPLLAYAELENELDSRCHETALRIKKRYLDE